MTTAPAPDLEALHAKLKMIREKKDLAARPTPNLRSTFTALDGTERPLKLRYYQVQGVMHLLAMKRFLLGDDTGLGKCVTRDTLVLTDRGLLEIGTLGPRGDLPPDTFHPLSQPTLVWTGWRWAPVKSFYVSGWKPTLHLRTRRGYEIEGSLVHPLWVRPAGGREVFVQIGDLSLGEHVCVSREVSSFPNVEPQIPVPDSTGFAENARKFNVPGGLTPDLAALLGYVVAEGWTASRWGFTITQHRDENPEVHDHIRRLCETVLGWVGDEGNKSRDTTINVSSVYLRDYLMGLGVGYDLSASKCVPWPIFQGTQDSLISFLRAFFDGEGSVTGGTVEVTSASERMLREVQVLLLRLGIVCTRSRKKVRGRDHTYWRLAICGDDARIFAAQVGFLTPRKTQALSELVAKVSNTNLDVVPHARKDIRELRTELVRASARNGSNANRKGSGLKQFGVSFEKTLNNIEVADRDPSYSFLGKLLRVAEQLGVVDTPAYLNLSKVMSSHFFYDPVVEITKGENEVVDIEVDDPNHSFVANGIVSHNTLESIAALCYLWERTPDLKCIILTTKSAIEQWRGEFRNFTTGVTVIVCKGSPAQRRKAREEYESATGPTVLVMGYRSAVQDFTDLQDWEGYVFLNDECFDYYTPVLLDDGTTELIGRIVSKKMPVRVLSWNPSTGLVEPKTVTNWFRNPLIAGKRKDLRRVSFRYSGNVRVTGSHEFHTPSGKTPVYKLRVGSPVFHYTTKIPSEAQWQVLLGSLLGDSSIANPNRNLSGMSFGHCEKQRDLLSFKHGVLSSLGVSEINWGVNGGYPKKDGTEKLHGRFTLDGNPSLSQFIDTAGIRREGKKRVTTEWLDRIGPLGMAVWYADDGCLNTHVNNDGITSYYVNISTHGFTREDHEVMVGWLRWRWGIRAEVRTARATGSGRKTYSYLHLNRDASELFFALLPGSIPGVKYKFPAGMPLVDVASDLSPGRGLVEDSITGLDRWSPQPNHRYVYDIEVEDNHNYFANGTLVSNCTAYKNNTTQVHQVCRHLSSKAERTWALTATLIKNSLIEGWGIYQVVAPGLFGNKNSFLNEYCITRMQTLPGSRRQVPVIVGYRQRDILAFREKIDPYFLGRPKSEVASDLPPLVIKHVKVPLTKFQQEKYAEALSGLLEVGKGDQAEEREVTKLTAVTYCQQIVNHPELIGCDGDSTKLDELVELLQEGDLEGEKVIVFSRFRKMIDIIVPALKKAKIRSVRITGFEDEKERRASQDAFQDPASDVTVCCITTAAAEAINLQAAKAIIFFDTPWSAGDYLQLIGRMIRIGSTHDRCYAVHLIAEGTIDDRVTKVLAKKMGLVESVLGKRIKGESDDSVVASENDLSDLFDGLVQDAKRVRGGR